MIAYADTGFLISLYGEDDNSAQASALIKRQPVFILTPLGEMEFLNAVELRVSRKDWTSREARAVREEFVRHQGVGLFQMELLGSEVWRTARNLSRRHTAKLGVRTLDLLHVAAAIAFKPEAFYSFDQRQRKLATVEGLHVLPA
ncbi:MAG TPA: type II toxin-antitoxin system VapC family toxin [Terriglobia bacterium]|nr:type II toxin-antitoxin system VapC family toxin [Terriglobia bacterium]